MKLVCFNINSIRARLHQLQAIIHTHKPDIIGLQETKVHDSEFPLEAVREMGYHVEFYGQKAHYGVAILSRQAPTGVQKGFPNDTEQAQRRVIMAEFIDSQGRPFKVINGYFPQGENINHEIKFPAKCKFYTDLQDYLIKQCDNSSQLVVMGDLNISALDIDIGIGASNIKRWLKDGKTSFQPVEREWYQRLIDWGLHDSLRLIYPDRENIYSWFDYRSKMFDREPKRGLRIDAILITNTMKARLINAGVDYEIRAMEKPSDHAPVWIELN